MKKALIFFFALLLPVLIFLFLRSFGKNEFDVPVLFSDVDSMTFPIDCKDSSFWRVPYVVEDSVLARISWRKQDSLTVILFDDMKKINQHERKIHVERIFNEFKGEPIQVIHIFNDRLIVDFKRDVNLKEVSLGNEELARLRGCAFLLTDQNDAVIIDSRKRIRGQYNLTKREDADRMIMQEMNILLKRY